VADKKNKRGLSEVISYILLIVIAIVMSILVYQWLRTYVPTESVACNDGTSIFIKNISYDCTKHTLSVTVQNNGKFGIDGYFIHASNNPDSDALATVDISSKITAGGIIFGNSIRFSDSMDNSLSPEDVHNVQVSTFNVTSFGGLYKIEITPFRMQTVDNKKRVVSCSDAKVDETLTCNS
jgi:hypothetical protein